MTDRVTTDNIGDLLDIFDPKVQEPDDVGGARIIYTFTENKEPIRERVGEQFILEVGSPKVSFFVTAPIEGNIVEGTIVISTPLEGVQDRYTLSQSDLERLVRDVSIALDYDETEVAKLLTD